MRKFIHPGSRKNLQPLNSHYKTGANAGQLVCQWTNVVVPFFEVEINCPLATYPHVNILVYGNNGPQKTFEEQCMFGMRFNGNCSWKNAPNTTQRMTTPSPAPRTSQWAVLASLNSHLGTQEGGARKIMELIYPVFQSTRLLLEICFDFQCWFFQTTCNTTQSSHLVSFATISGQLSSSHRQVFATTATAVHQVKKHQKLIGWKYSFVFFSQLVFRLAKIHSLVIAIQYTSSKPQFQNGSYVKLLKWNNLNVKYQNHWKANTMLSWMVTLWVIATTARIGWIPFSECLSCHATAVASLFQDKGGGNILATWDWVSLVPPALKSSSRTVKMTSYSCSAMQQRVS